LEGLSRPTINATVWTARIGVTKRTEITGAELPDMYPADKTIASGDITSGNITFANGGPSQYQVLGVWD
jgi:hypothetical protein